MWVKLFVVVLTMAFVISAGMATAAQFSGADDLIAASKARVKAINSRLTAENDAIAKQYARRSRAPIAARAVAVAAAQAPNDKFLAPFKMTIFLPRRLEYREPGTKHP